MTELPAPVRRRRSPGARSRAKGLRGEQMIARLLVANGFKATKISGMYRPGEDIRVRLLGVDHAVEVKCRGDGFRELYAWLRSRDILIKADRQEPLVVLRLSLAVEVPKATALRADL
jgi:hypothetical protein